VQHLLASVAMGLAYAALAGRRLQAVRPASELVVIVVFSLASWAFYQWLVMPWLAPVMDARTEALSLAVAHVVFALAFAVAWLPYRG
jgi:MFS superfamily sulfate permease-like transporter